MIDTLCVTINMIPQVTPTIGPVHAIPTDVALVLLDDQVPSRDLGRAVLLREPLIPLITLIPHVTQGAAEGDLSGE